MCLLTTTTVLSGVYLSETGEEDGKEGTRLVQCRGGTYGCSTTFLLVTCGRSRWLRLARHTEYWLSLPARWLWYGNVWNHSLQIQGIVGIPGWVRGTPSTYSCGAISWVPNAHLLWGVNSSVICFSSWHNQRGLLSSQLLLVGSLLWLHCIAGWSLVASSCSTWTTAHPTKLKREHVMLEARLRAICTQMGQRREGLPLTDL
jgi:hypothetical protein